MKTTFAHFVSLTHKINRQHVQLVLAVLTLALLVLGAGAPMAGGGVSG